MANLLERLFRGHAPEKKEEVDIATLFDPATMSAGLTGAHGGGGVQGSRTFDQNRRVWIEQAAIQVQADDGAWVANIVGTHEIGPGKKFEGVNGKFTLAGFSGAFNETFGTQTPAPVTNGKKKKNK